MSTLNFARHFSPKSAFPLSAILAPITVRTCTDIYPQLRQTSPLGKFYQKNPPIGFDLTVHYADSALSSHPSKFDKTIVAIHGVFGYCSHFEQLFKHYHGSRVRVIAPNMPDFTHTQQHGFWHTTTEKGSFIKDFLTKLEVDQVDCLVSHSSGIHTASTLWGEPGPIKVNSVALFSPMTGLVKYNRKLDHMAKLFTFRNQLWYDFLKLIRIHRSPYWPIKYNNITEFLTTAVLFLDPNTPNELLPRLDYLVNKTSIPISIFGGAKDVLGYPKSIGELYKRLGINMADIVLVDTEKDRPEIVMAKTGKRMNSYLIKSGGHFSHQKNSNFTKHIIDTLLSYQDESHQERQDLRSHRNR